MKTYTGLGLSTSTVGTRFTYAKLSDEVKQKCSEELFVQLKDSGLNGINPGIKGIRRLIVDSLQQHSKQWSWTSDLTMTCWFLISRKAFSILDNPNGDQREQESIRYALSHLVLEKDYLLKHFFAKMMRNLGSPASILECRYCEKIRETYPNAPSLAHAGNIFKYEHNGLGCLSPTFNGTVVVANVYSRKGREYLQVLEVLESTDDSNVVQEGAVLVKAGFEYCFISQPGEPNCDSTTCTHRPLAHLFVQVMEEYIGPSVPGQKSDVIEPLATDVQFVDRVGIAMYRKMQDLEHWNVQSAGVSGYVVDANVSSLKTTFCNMIEAETKTLSSLKRLYLSQFALSCDDLGVSFCQRLSKKEIMQTIEDVLEIFFSSREVSRNHGWLWKPGLQATSNLERMFNYTWRLTEQCLDDCFAHLTQVSGDMNLLTCPVILGFPGLDDEGINENFTKLISLIDKEKCYLLMVQCSPKTLSESTLLRKLFNLITDQLSKCVIICSCDQSVLNGWKELFRSNTNKLEVIHFVIGEHEQYEFENHYFYLPDDNDIQAKQSGEDQLAQLMQWFNVLADLPGKKADLEKLFTSLPMFLLTSIDATLIDAVLLKEKMRTEKQTKENIQDKKKNETMVAKGSTAVPLTVVYVGELPDIVTGDDYVSKVIRMIHYSALEDANLASINVSISLEHIKEEFWENLPVCYQTSTGDAHQPTVNLSGSLKEVLDDDCENCTQFKADLNELSTCNEKELVKRLLKKSWRKVCGATAKRQALIIKKIAGDVLHHLELVTKQIKGRLLIVPVGQVASRLTDSLMEKLIVVPFIVPHPAKAKYANNVDQLNNVRKNLWLLMNYLIAFQQNRLSEPNLLTSLKLKRGAKKEYFYDQLAKIHESFDDWQLKVQTRHAMHQLGLLVAKEAEGDAKRLNYIRYGEHMIDSSKVIGLNTVLHAEELSKPIQTAIDVCNHSFNGFEPTLTTKSLDKGPCSQLVTSTQVHHYEFLNLITASGFTFNSEECKQQLRELLSSNSVDELLDYASRWTMYVKRDLLGSKLLRLLEVQNDDHASASNSGNAQQQIATRSQQQVALYLVRIRLIVIIHLTTRVPRSICVHILVTVIYLGAWYYDVNFALEPLHCSKVVRYLHRSAFGVDGDDSFTAYDVLPTRKGKTKGFGSLVACNNTDCENCNELVEQDYWRQGKKKKLLFQLPQKPQCEEALKKYDSLLNYLSFALAIHLRISKMHSQYLLVVPLGKTAYEVVRHAMEVKELKAFFACSSENSGTVVYPYQVQHPNAVQFKKEEDDIRVVQQEYYKLYKFLVRFKTNPAEIVRDGAATNVAESTSNLATTRADDGMVNGTSNVGVGTSNVATDDGVSNVRLDAPYWTATRADDGLVNGTWNVGVGTSNVVADDGVSNVGVGAPCWTTTRADDGMVNGTSNAADSTSNVATDNGVSNVRLDAPYWTATRADDGMVNGTSNVGVGTSNVATDDGVSNVRLDAPYWTATRADDGMVNGTSNAADSTSNVATDDGVSNVRLDAPCWTTTRADDGMVNGTSNAADSTSNVATDDGVSNVRLDAPYWTTTRADDGLVNGTWNVGVGTSNVATDNGVSNVRLDAPYWTTTRADDGMVNGTSNAADSTSNVATDNGVSNVRLDAPCWTTTRADDGMVNGTSNAADSTSNVATDNGVSNVRLDAPCWTTTRADDGMVNGTSNAADSTSNVATDNGVSNVRLDAPYWTTTRADDGLVNGTWNVGVGTSNVVADDGVSNVGVGAPCWTATRADDGLVNGAWNAGVGTSNVATDNGVSNVGVGAPCWTATRADDGLVNGAWNAGVGTSNVATDNGVSNVGVGAPCWTTTRADDGLVNRAWNAGVGTSNVATDNGVSNVRLDAPYWTTTRADDGMVNGTSNAADSTSNVVADDGVSNVGVGAPCWTATRADDGLVNGAWNAGVGTSNVATDNGVSNVGVGAPCWTATRADDGLVNGAWNAGVGTSNVATDNGVSNVGVGAPCWTATRADDGLVNGAWNAGVGTSNVATDNGVSNVGVGAPCWTATRADGGMVNGAWNAGVGTSNVATDNGVSNVRLDAPYWTATRADDGMVNGTSNAADSTSNVVADDGVSNVGVGAPCWTATRADDGLVNGAWNAGVGTSNVATDNGVSNVGVGAPCWTATRADDGLVNGAWNAGVGTSNVATDNGVSNVGVGAPCWTATRADDGLVNGAWNAGVGTSNVATDNGVSNVGVGAPCWTATRADDGLVNGAWNAGVGTSNVATDNGVSNVGVGAPCWTATRADGGMVNGAWNAGVGTSNVATDNGVSNVRLDAPYWTATRADDGMVNGTSNAADSTSNVATDDGVSNVRLDAPYWTTTRADDGMVNGTSNAADSTSNVATDDGVSNVGVGAPCWTTTRADDGMVNGTSNAADSTSNSAATRMVGGAINVVDSTSYFHPHCTVDGVATGTTFGNRGPPFTLDTGCAGSGIPGAATIGVCGPPFTLDAGDAAPGGYTTAAVTVATNTGCILSEADFVKTLIAVYPLFATVRQPRSIQNLQLPVAEDLQERGSKFNVHDQLSSLLLQWHCHHKSIPLRQQVEAFKTNLPSCHTRNKLERGFTSGDINLATNQRGKKRQKEETTQQKSKCLIVLDESTDLQSVSTVRSESSAIVATLPEEHSETNPVSITSQEYSEGGFIPNTVTVKIVPDASFSHKFVAIDKKLSHAVLVDCIHKVLTADWLEQFSQKADTGIHQVKEVVKEVLIEMISYQWKLNTSQKQTNKESVKKMYNEIPKLVQNLFDAAKKGKTSKGWSRDFSTLHSNSLAVLFDIKIQNCFDKSLAVSTDGLSLHVTCGKADETDTQQRKDETKTEEKETEQYAGHTISIGLDVGKSGLVFTPVSSRSRVGKSIMLKARSEKKYQSLIEELQTSLLEKNKDGGANRIGTTQQVLESVSTLCRLLFDVLVVVQHSSNRSVPEKEHQKFIDTFLRFAAGNVNSIRPGIDTTTLRELHWYKVLERIDDGVRGRFLSKLRELALQSANIRKCLCSMVAIATDEHHVLSSSAMDELLKTCNPRRPNASARVGNITEGLYNHEMKSTHLKQVFAKVLQVFDSCLKDGVTHHTLESGLVKLNHLELDKEAVQRQLKYRFEVFPLLDFCYNANALKHIRRERDVLHRRFIAKVVKMLTKDMVEAIESNGEQLLQSNVSFPRDSVRSRERATMMKKGTTTTVQKQNMDKLLQSNTRFRTFINRRKKASKVSSSSPKTCDTVMSTNATKEKKPPDKRLFINVDNFHYGSSRTRGFPCQKVLRHIMSYVASREDLRTWVTICLGNGIRSSKQGAPLAAYLCNLGQIDHQEVGPQTKRLENWQGPVHMGFKYFYDSFSKTISTRDAPAAMSMAILKLIEIVGAPRPDIWRHRNKNTKIWNG